MGQCVISLQDALGPAPSSFVAQLTCGGLPAGELRGKIWLRWSAPGADDEDNEDNAEDSVIGEKFPSSGTASSGASGGVGGVGGVGVGSGSGSSGGAGSVAMEVIKTGFLLKQGSKVKSWKRRWFVLTSNGDLSYFVDRKAQRPLDRVHVDSVAPAPNAGKLNCLAIRSGDKRQLIFCADSAEDYDAWLKVLSSLSKKPE